MEYYRYYFIEEEEVQYILLSRKAKLGIAFLWRSNADGTKEKQFLRSIVFGETKYWDWAGMITYIDDPDYPEHIKKITYPVLAARVATITKLNYRNKIIRDLFDTKVY
jgi:hypothetical protein